MGYSGQTIDIDDLAKSVMASLSDYAAEVDAATKQVSVETGRFVRKRVKELSPVRTGKYAKGWRSKREKDGHIVVYNAKKPRLTHLLEYGHARRKGGRQVAAPHPHIKTAEEEGAAFMENRLKQILETLK